MDLLRLTTAFFCILTATAEYIPNVCKEVTTNNGLIPPVLPDSFLWKAEITDLVNKTIGWEETYFDSENVRGKYKYVLNGVEKNFIFDYDVEQVVSYTRYHPGVSFSEDTPSQRTCYAVDMADSKLKNLFGYRNNQLLLKRPQIFTSNGVLRFGGEYNFQYVNQEDDLREERGYPVNAFQGCVYDKWNEATVNSTYYWSKGNFVPAPGDIRKLGEKIAVLPVPVKVKYHGGQYEKNNEGKKQQIKVDKSHNAVWFKRDPKFTDQDFQVPLRTYCENYRKILDMPKLSNHFSARVEKTIVERSQDGKRTSSIEDYFEIWYDYNLKLIRRDFPPNDEFPDSRQLYPSAVFVTGVYDFITGIVYWIEPVSGQCTPKVIDNNDPMTEKGAIGLYMVQAESILQISSDKVEYKGKYFVRDIECNVWGRKERSGNESLTTTYQEFYFPTEGFHSEAGSDEEYYVPVRSVLQNYTRANKKFSAKSVDWNFFKFNPLQPRVTVYDISSCLEHYTHRYFMITLEGVEVKTALDNADRILPTVQMEISSIGRLATPLRCQELQLAAEDNKLLLKFALMDKVPVQSPVPVSFPGESLDKAVEIIRTVVAQGDFSVPVTIDSLHVTLYLQGTSFYEFAKEGHHGAPLKTPRKEEDSVSEDPNVTKQPGDDDDDDSGYGPGSFGSLCFFMLLIGLIIGIGMMVYYHRRYGLSSKARSTP